MKTIDLKIEHHSIYELFAFAKMETILVRLATGEEFVIEQADQIEREVVALSGSAKFMSFLEARSKETEDITIQEVRQKRNL